MVTTKPMLNAHNIPMCFWCCVVRPLHREGHKTSTGTRWPAKNDGRVVVRLLINHGVAPVAGDFKIARYVAEYAAKVAEPRAR